MSLRGCSRSVRPADPDAHGSIATAIGSVQSAGSHDRTMKD
jgi:hypothetical protein